MNYVTASSNLKELVYDKFKGLKKFQIVAIASEEAGAQIETLKTELTQYESLKYWHFLMGSDFAIGNFFSYLNSDFALNEDLGSNHVYIIDKELMQRGRLDDRSKQEKIKPYHLTHCIHMIVLRLQILKIKCLKICGFYLLNIVKNVKEISIQILGEPVI